MSKSLVLSSLVLLVGCSVGDATRPIPQPDTLVFGRIAAIRVSPEDPGSWEVEIRAGLPETLQAVMRREKRPIPQLEKDLLVRAEVSGDTICIADLLPKDLDSFRVGQEVAVVPRPGSCAMVGTKLLLLEAGEFYLFASYQVRFLARSLESLPLGVTGATDERRINSCGLERTPLLAGGGKAVYFAAGLLPPLKPGEAPRGAVRPGMSTSEGEMAPWAVGGYRPYRTEWQGQGWGAPQAVALLGLQPSANARLTWVNDEETRCLIEVEDTGKPRELLAVQRGKASEAWGGLEKVALASGSSVGDGQRFGTKLGALVWTVYDANGSDLWLSLDGKPGQAVEPRINTLGFEWAPRVGPNNSLFFCRGERQLAFSGGLVREVRLPGKQLRPLVEAVPVMDGNWLLFRVPRYVPGELDWDLAAAPRAGAGWGDPVALDEWKPVAPTRS